MKITGIDCHVLVAPGYRRDAASSAQDGFVVEVHTDEGLDGIGEADLNPWIAQACIEARGTHNMGLGLREMLIGANPLDPSALWDRLYVGSAMNGRRGAVIHAMGAIDIALWDIAGKATGVPTYHLLGKPVRDHVTPYASLQPERDTYRAFRDEMVDWAVRAKALGFKAAKLEMTFDGPYCHMGLHVPDECLTEVLQAVRDAVGDDMVLMVDVQYMWDDVDRCLRTIEKWPSLGVYFVETPLQSDDLDGYARLHEATGRPLIAAGEWLATRFEFAELLDHGRIDVAQPDIGRVGGLTEARRVAALAHQRGVPVVPHLFKSAISIAAAVQFAAVTPDCPYIEFVPPTLTESRLRKELTLDEPRMVDGIIPLPTEPGLGPRVNRKALEDYAAREP